mgnify:FL=1
MSEPTPEQIAIRHTERDMLDALHNRYSVVSQGDSIRYACAEQ